MFPSFFNQVKEGLASAAAEPPPPPPQAPPSKPSPPQQTESCGSDFLGGLLNVAKEVGQALNEKQQPPPPPPPPPEPTAADLLGGLLNAVGHAVTEKNQPEVKQSEPTPQKQQNGSKISQEDIALISKGLGALVTTITEKTASKGVEEEQVAKVDSQGGKVQLSSVVGGKEVPAAHTEQQQQPAAGSDFLSGLMSVAKEVGKAMNEQQVPVQPAPPPQQTSKLSQEDIAKITQGLSTLVGKAFNKSTNEGEATKTDSQGGKAQLSSEGAGPESKSGGQQAAENDFLSGLLNMAKDVGKKLSDQPGTQTDASASANSQSSSKVTQEDIGKLVLALGPLVNTIKDKAFTKKEEAVEEVAKVDSQGGNVQLSSVQDSTDATRTSAEQGAQPPAAEAANQQFSQEDVARITAGLGFLGTLIKDKAGDIFQKPPAEKEKEKEKPKEEPVIDDVEGEIGRVVLSGYTGDTTVAAKSKNE